MAALNETDLKAIMGADFNPIAMAELAQGAPDTERSLRTRLTALDDSKFPAAVTIFVGILLVVAAWFTASGKEFQIQVGVGIVIALLGAFLFSRILKNMKGLQGKLDTLRTSAA